MTFIEMLFMSWILIFFFFFYIPKNADTLKLNSLFLSISFIATSEVR